MTAVECSRGFEADAIQDRRLAGADRASFERHAATCASCARRVRMLSRLDALANDLPDSSVTQLERRRMRSTLLREANELTLRQPEPRRSRLVVLAFATLALVAVAAIAFRGGPTPPPIPVAAAVRVPSYHMDTAPGSTWDVLQRTTTLRLGIRAGRFDLAVDKLAADQRFLLELPDGELEVKGTQFRVEVSRGHTRRVSVSEGLVALRLRGQAAILLGANESWNEPTPRAPEPAPPASTAARRPRPSVENPPTPPSSTAGQDFSKAMAAFNAGDYGSAEQLFIAFEEMHPSEQRVEDALFLRAVARSRRGDRAGASQLAAEYLRRYPKGLRRFEAEELRDH